MSPLRDRIAATDIDAVDVEHLRRCIDLARAAAERGDQPFGSLLVNGDGQVVAEDQNRVVTTSDITAHPEITLARWAAARATEAERAEMTMYTSGEHCPMCATAHFSAGIGRLVYALDGDTMRAHQPPGHPTLALPVRDLFAYGNRDLAVAGPFAELVDEVLALFGRG